MSDSFQADREHITTPQAEQLSGLSRNYLTKLLRKGTLEGFQFGRDWIVYKDSLERFLAAIRKPGPKGPHKNTSSDSLSSTATD